MSLYDMIDGISAREAVKTSTGDTLITGVVIGTVAKNYDKDMPGRVCVLIPTRDKERNELKWARVAQVSGGPGWGHYFLPEVDDQVLLAFEGGSIEKPYVIGCVPRDNFKFLTGSADEHNQIKRVVTRNGSTVTFEDNKEGDGGKDKIRVETAGQAHTLLMDNENKVIRVTDKDKRNCIELKTEDGEMTVKAASRLTIQVGDTIKIICNGESGGLKITASDITLEASNQLKAKCDGMTAVEAAQIKIEASSMMKTGSNGMTQITGSPIKIG